MITIEQKSVIKNVLRPINPSMIGIFGSYARNEAKEGSDMDLLIDIDESINLMYIIGLEQEMACQLGLKVDLITLRSLNESIKPFIMKNLIVIS